MIRNLQDLKALITINEQQINNIERQIKNQKQDFNAIVELNRKEILHRNQIIKYLDFYKSKIADHHLENVIYGPKLEELKNEYCIIEDGTKKDKDYKATFDFRLAELANFSIQDLRNLKEKLDNERQLQINRLDTIRVMYDFRLRSRIIQDIEIIDRELKFINERISLNLLN